MPRLALSPSRYLLVAFFIILFLWFQIGSSDQHDDGSGHAPVGPDSRKVVPEPTKTADGPDHLVPVGSSGETNPGRPSELEPTMEMVVASMKHEDTSWFNKFLPDWNKNIYVVDDPDAPLTVPKNKGREAMVILTYLIDRYHTLPNYILFHHSNRFAWHNDGPDYDDLPLLRRFNQTYLGEQGYVNLRCVWVLGCPAEIHPEDDEQMEYDDKLTARKSYAESFRELFPGEKMPLEVGVPCCSQFGVSREAVLRHTKEDYIRYRTWLLNTDLDDGVSGRVFEYAWHMIFGKQSTHCPNAGECYCRVYGMCNMPNCDKSRCEGWYTLPKYATLPEGWPRKGWQGEDRAWEGEI